MTGYTQNSILNDKDFLNTLLQEKKEKPWEITNKELLPNVSKINLIMTEGIQKFIANEKDLLNIMLQETKDKPWEITNKDLLPKMSPSILYHYLNKASEIIANKKNSLLSTIQTKIQTKTQNKLTSLIDDEIIKSIVEEVIKGDNILFKDQYLDVKDSVYPDSFKVFNNNGFEITSDKIYNGKKITKNIAPDKMLVCKKGFFMDLITESISTKLLFNEETKMNHIIKFQYIVNTFFTKIRDEYVRQLNDSNIKNSDIIFTYKGGTVMKILFERYSKIYNTDEFNDIFKKYFKRSDSDYSFIINYKLDVNLYNKIYYHITKLSIYALKYLKKIFLDNKEYILGINTINNNDIKDLCLKINHQLEKIRNLPSDERYELKKTTDCNEFLKIDKFIGVSAYGRDYFSEEIPELNKDNIYFLQSNIVDDNINNSSLQQQFINNKKISIDKQDFLVTKNNINNNDPYLINNLNSKKPNLDNKHYFYITANETPFGVTYYKTYYDGTPLTSNVLSFFLSRLKINIVFYYRTHDNKYGYINIPSELIDLSISKQMSYDSILSYKNFNNKFVNYRYIYEKNTDINFVGFSPNGFISDLNKVFFYSIKYPWLDNKYEKRLYRLCYFLILAIKEKNVNINTFITLILNYINSVLNKTTDIQEKFTLLQNYFEKNDLNVDNFSFIESIIFINKNIVMNTIYPSEEKNYNEFFTVFKEIFEKLKQIENNKLNISEFSFSNFTITETDSNSKIIKIDQLGGNLHIV